MKRSLLALTLLLAAGGTAQAGATVWHCDQQGNCGQWNDVSTELFAPSTFRLLQCGHVATARQDRYPIYRSPTMAPPVCSGEPWRCDWGQGFGVWRPPCTVQVQPAPPVVVVPNRPPEVVMPRRPQVVM